MIDGRIGYIGGFNVGDEYLGLNRKFGYWRDTHLRIEGSAVHPLQTRFLLDWNQASQKNRVHYSERYFPVVGVGFQDFLDGLGFLFQTLDQNVV